MAAVTVCGDFAAQENKICHYFHFSSSICHKVMGPDAIMLVFWMLNFQSAFSLSSFTFIKRLFSFPLCFLPLDWYHLHMWSCWYFSWQSRFQLVIHPAWHFAWCTPHMIQISKVAIYSLDMLLSRFYMLSILCIKQITNENLLYRTGKATPFSVVT